MPRSSSSSYHRRHRDRRRSDSSVSSRDERDEYYYKDRSRKKSSDYYSRSNSSKKKSKSKTYRDKSKRKGRRSTSSSNDSSTSNSTNKSVKTSPVPPPPPSIKDHQKSELPVQAPINLNVLDGKLNTQTLDEINEDNFQQKTFTSNKSVSEKVIIDLKKDTIFVPTTVKSNVENESVFHPDFLGDEDISMEKWIKKLYSYRQRHIIE